MRLLHKKLAYELNGCFYDVQNEVGLGFDEETYHLALEEYLKQKGISYKSKVIGHLEQRGKRVHKFIVDLIIEGKIVVELKCTSLNFVPANYLQTISYLKSWKLDLGILVNFGQESVKIKRIPFTEKEYKVIEDYTEIEPYIDRNNRNYLRLIRQSILFVLKCHGLGYDSNIYKALLEEEFRYNKVPFSTNVLIPVTFKEKVIRNFELKYPLVNNTIICGILAVQEDITTDLFKMRNYLNRTGQSIGLIIHFGKEKLEIIGVST